MSNENKIPNEDELWNMLSEPVTTESAPKSVKPEPQPVQPEPREEPEIPSRPTPEAPKSQRKIDKFFITCMASVAAVSVALTLVVSSFFGGNTAAPSGSASSSGEGSSVSASELERENAELKAQLELQKEQVKKLQSDLMTLMGSEEYLATASTNPEENNEALQSQLNALDTLAQIQDAYAEFDREKLEELIPQMDAQLEYLSPEALNEYYLILEYVEQPSNDQ